MERETDELIAELTGRAQAAQQGAETIQGDLRRLKGVQDRLEEARVLGEAARGERSVDHTVLRAALAVLARHEEAIQLLADGLHEDAQRALMGKR